MHYTKHYSPYCEYETFIIVLFLGWTIHNFIATKTTIWFCISLLILYYNIFWRFRKYFLSQKAHSASWRRANLICPLGTFYLQKRCLLLKLDFCHHITERPFIHVIFRNGAFDISCFYQLFSLLHTFKTINDLKSYQDVVGHQWCLQRRLDHPLQRHCLQF